MASNEKGSAAAVRGAAGSAAGESGGASSPVRQSSEGQRQGRVRGRTLARRGSLLGLEQASSKGDRGQGLGAWKVPPAWLEKLCRRVAEKWYAVPYAQNTKRFTLIRGRRGCNGGGGVLTGIWHDEGFPAFLPA